MVGFVPAGTRRLLDVGCDTGRFGRSVREVVPLEELWGVDPQPAVDGGTPGYDVRLHGYFPDALAADEQFNCICFNDVLEHMPDPWAALVATRAHLQPGGTVVASIPNVRHWQQVLRPLLVEGRWDYEECGILDRTHLRFFTRAGVLALFHDTGYAVERIAGIRPESTTGKLALLDRLSRGRLHDFVVERYALVATPVGC